MALAFFRQTGNLDFQGVSGVIHVRNFDLGAGDLLSGQVLLSGANGSDVSVEDTGLGLKMSARKMTCLLVADGAGHYRIQKATLDGKADVVIDSRVAAKAASDAARAKHSTAPAADTATAKLHLVSDHLDYERRPTETMITSPTPFDYTETRTGAGKRTEGKIPMDILFAQSTHLSGADAQLTVDPLAAKPSTANPSADAQAGKMLRTVELNGGVKMDIERTETHKPSILAAQLEQANSLTDPPATLTTTDIMHASADKLTGDFVTPGDPTIVLSGNTHIEGAGRGYSVNGGANEATFWLDRESDQLKRYRLVGKPATTTLGPATTPAPTTPAPTIRTGNSQ